MKIKIDQLRDRYKQAQSQVNKLLSITPRNTSKKYEDKSPRDTLSRPLKTMFDNHIRHKEGERKMKYKENRNKSNEKRSKSNERNRIKPTLKEFDVKNKKYNYNELHVNRSLPHYSSALSADKTEQVVSNIFNDDIHDLRRNINNLQQEMINVKNDNVPFTIQSKQTLDKTIDDINHIRRQIDRIDTEHTDAIHSIYGLKTQITALESKNNIQERRIDIIEKQLKLQGYKELNKNEKYDEIDYTEYIPVSSNKKVNIDMDSEIKTLREARKKAE